MKIRFITSAYGPDYGGMLLSLLYSIAKSHPGAAATVFWQDVSERDRFLPLAFPNVSFVEVERPMGTAAINRISNKTLLFADALRRHGDECLVLLDVDMLVIKPLDRFFVEHQEDVLFTYKNERWPLNTGILLVRPSPRVVGFFLAWAERTSEILRDPELVDQAASWEYPYGGPDQMSFSQLINFRPGQLRYNVACRGEQVTMAGVPCAELNETNSRPVTAQTRVIHYKGGWHPILLRGTDFTAHRPKSDSFEMYLLYLRTYKEAVANASHVLGLPARRLSGGIKIPFYLDRELKESSLLYRVFAIREAVLRPLRGRLRGARRRFRKLAQRFQCL